MIDFFIGLQHQLLQEINVCEKNNADFKIRTECCFHVCEKYNLIVEEKSQTAVFDHEEEEITFFKSIKPFFKSMVELYSLLYRSHLFGPESVEEKSAYWQSERERAERFLSENRLLHQYIRSGETKNDRQMFLRDSPGAEERQRLLSQIKSREMYIDFIVKKIA